MNARVPSSAVLFGLAVLAFAACAAIAAPPSSDLALTLSLEGSSGGGNFTASTPYHLVAFVENRGGGDAVAFEVDLWANDSHGSIWTRHSLQVTGLAAGGNLSLVDPTPFEIEVAGTVVFHGIADPADRVNDSAPGNNAPQLTVAFAAPPAQVFVEQAGGRLSGVRTLPAYSLLALRVVVTEGDSIIFKADAEAGSTVDCYLFNEANFTVYANAREAPNAAANITYFGDYTHVSTDHFAFTTEPMPPGVYYVVVDNDDRLQRGASPTGSVNVTFAVALVNNSLPPAAIAVILGAAAAAVWATVRWRPVFDVRSPLLEVPSPDLSAEDENEAGGEAQGPPEMTEGEGPPPHPP